MAKEPDEAPEHYEDEGGPVKSFLEHLEDLRWVLVKSGVAVGIAMLFCLIAGDRLVGVLKWPLGKATLPPPPNQTVTFLVGTNRLGSFGIGTNQLGALNLGTNRDITFGLQTIEIGSNQVLALQLITNYASAPKTLAESVQLLNLNPAGGFFVAFQVAIYGGLLLAAPFVFYFLGDFILPALRFNEKKYVMRGFLIGTGLFMAGVAFCYFVMMPMALRASVKYSEWLGFSANQWRAEEYVSFVCKFLLGMGLGFELPVVVLTMVRIGLLTYSQLKAFRKYMIAINLVLGAVLTTPEVLTQVMMAIPLQVLYEISVQIAGHWERQERKREAIDVPASD
jgi:sec-independent protein translocase protein TatC